MSITGRDILERTLLLEMDWGKCRWIVLGEEHEVMEHRDELEFKNDPLVKTIDSTISAMSEVLLEDDPNAPTLIKTIWGTGYILSLEDGK